MKTSTWLLPVAGATSAALLAFGYGLQGYWPAAGVLATMGAAWVLARGRRWDAFRSLLFACFVAAAGIGVVLSVQAFLLAAGVTTALAAWDIDHFSRRVAGAYLPGDLRAIERAHLRRLLLVCGLGLALSAVALLLQVHLRFSVAFLLAALILLALGRQAAWIQEEYGPNADRP